MDMGIVCEKVCLDLPQSCVIFMLQQYCECRPVSVLDKKIIEECKKPIPPDELGNVVIGKCIVMVTANIACHVVGMHRAIAIGFWEYCCPIVCAERT
jgi:hypothetical protein